MTEELPLPPDVRATQADALKHLAFPWPCDSEERTCDEGAQHGARTRCCRQTVQLCHRHGSMLLADFAAANLAGLALMCPRCDHIHPPPAHPGGIFDHHFELGGTA